MTRAETLETVRHLETIRAVLNWAGSRSPRPEVVDLVAQDEFTFDLVVRVAADFYLVFDTS